MMRNNRFKRRSTVRTQITRRLFVRLAAGSTAAGIGALLLQACASEATPVQTGDTATPESEQALWGQIHEPERNFDRLWEIFDQRYGIFGPKRIDWDALYAVYRPRVTAQTTNEELFEIMASLLGHLNDNHVNLRAPTRHFNAGILNDLEMDDFSLDLVKQKYLKGQYERRVDGIFHYGWLNQSVGYFHFSQFRDAASSGAAIDEIIQEFQDCAGIVVDVRANYGGDDRVGKLIADRMADQERLYMMTQRRDGLERDAFTNPQYWYVQPDGPLQFTQPVILLTHRHSISAAENFALAMRTLPHVTVVGDTTSGVFADVESAMLPNGWSVSVPYTLFLDHEGFCWEGIGVPPYIRQVNTKEDISMDRDKVLELAVALIDSGELKPRPESRHSLERAIV
jgi:hypothetical protein